MNKLLFWDVKTSNMVHWKESSDHPDQPHIVQIAAKLVDTDTRRTLHSFEYIVKPMGWKIKPETIEIHGITQELASLVGVDEEFALRSFMKLWAGGNPRAAYSINFDDRIMRIAMKRYLDPEVAAHVSQAYKEAEKVDVLQMVRSWKKYSKTPKLTQVYTDLFCDTMDCAHNAMCDTCATCDVYFGLLEEGVEI